MAQFTCQLQALADLVSDVLGTSLWMTDTEAAQQALPPLKEYPVPKGFCEARLAKRTLMHASPMIARRCAAAAV